MQKSQIYLFDNKIGLNKRLIQIITKIRENDYDGSIAVIARYNYLLSEAKEAVYNADLHNKVKFWSYHRSKGLEADYCILIGFSQGCNGFPNESKDNAIIEALLPSLDEFPFSEERRLLYVGLTRAKKKIYIIADPTAPSAFITELLSPKFELDIISETFQEQYQKIFKCPNCKGGYLGLKKSHHGEYYTCSTGLGCEVGKARKCKKCGAPSIDSRNASTCNNTACRSSIKICAKCGRPMILRLGGKNKFWGCSGYRIDQCKHIVNYTKS